MKINRLIAAAAFAWLAMTAGCSTTRSHNDAADAELADSILADTTMAHVDSMARELLKGSFNAGSGYSQVWARDLNTFIETACEVNDPSEIREAYDEIRPMLERVVRNDGFYEWYGQGEVPSGSGKFKGSAGVLAKAIRMLRDWAEEHKTPAKQPAPTLQ